MIKVLFICHGNICRSTMAQSVFTYLVKTHNMQDKFYIDSAATSREEIGNPPHHGTVRQLRAVGVPVIPHQAVQMTKADYEKFDLICAMDLSNLRNIGYITGGDPEGKVSLLLDFAGEHRAISDPWYTRNFDDAFNDITRGCEALLRHLEER